MAPPPQETGKQRASRIPLDYFKRSNRVERWKLWLTGLALVLAVGWWASGWVGSDQGQMRYSRGPVAAVHATWESECTVCHTPFQPIDSKNWASALLGKSHSTAERCETCHAGPAHHTNQKAESTPACAGCHHDHRGREASLVRVADRDCTQCHQNLKEHRTAASKDTFENKVTRFQKGSHPEFSVLREKEADPGKLKFNHQLHLTPGIVLTAGSEGAWTLGKIRDQADRERYRLMQPEGQRDDTSPIRLDCVSCHQLDSGDFGLQGGHVRGLPGGVLSKRGTGAYMQPITYENQCRACHPLSFDPADPDLAVPHRLQPDEVKSFLWGAYATKLAQKESKLPPPTVPSRPLPGKDLSAEEKKLRDEIERKVVSAEQFLYRDKVEAAEKLVFGHKKTCGECHDYQAEAPAIVPKRIEPPAVPEVWYTHAVFNHAMHRAVNCRECHPQAYADDKNASTASKDVMLPGIDNCLQCHSAPTHSEGVARGGARFDCVECHRYHNGDAPLHGLGAVRRAPQGKLNLSDFLSGKREAKAP